MNLRSFIGGNPIAVLIRIALLSVLVGFVLSFVGITPRNFFRVMDDIARHIYDLGFDAVTWLADYMVLGAMVVVPVWLLTRLLRSGTSNPN